MRLLRVWAILILALAGCRGDLTGEILSRIEGTVINKEDGKPIKQAMVYCYSCIRPGGGGSIFWRRGPFYTDGSGNFKVDRLKAGDFAVCVYKEGFAQVGPFRIVYELLDRGERVNLHSRISRPSHHVFPLKQGEVKHLDIQLEKEAVLELTVSRKTSAGVEPIDTVDLSASFVPLGAEDALTAYDNGKKLRYYGMEGERDFKLEVYPPGYPEITKTIHLAKGETKKMDVIVDFTLGQTISGVIKSKETGQPLYGIDVDLIDIDNKKSIDCITDENGEYLLGGFNPGKYKFSLWNANTDEEFETILTVKIDEKRVINYDF